MTSRKVDKGFAFVLSATLAGVLVARFLAYGGL